MSSILGILGIEVAHQTTPAMRRVARLLRALGWARAHTRTGNVWCAPSGWVDTHVPSSTTLTTLGLLTAPK